MGKKILQRQFLGKILVERKVIGQEQVLQALGVQKRHGGYFGEILIDLGYVEGKDIVAALVVQCHVPYIAIDRYEIDKSIIQLVPGNVAQKHHVVPLDRVSDILSVVMADPLDETAKAEVKRITKCNLAPFIATEGEIAKAIHRWYGVDAQE